MSFSPNSERNIVALARTAAKESVHSVAFAELATLLDRRSHVWVAQQRTKLGSKEYVADLLGVSRNTIANWESARGTAIPMPKADMLEAFVLALGERQGPGVRATRGLRSGVYPTVSEETKEREAV